MSIRKNIISRNTFENRKRYVEREKYVEEEDNRIAPGYASDIKTYRNYCEVTEQKENAESLLDYLWISITEGQPVKKNTWEKRLVGIKRYLAVTYGEKYDDYFQDQVKGMRKQYKKEEHAEFIKLEGKSAVNKEKLLEKINELDTRAKAICLVNLQTANRPSEMVVMQIKHFKLENNEVDIYMPKTNDWHHKRLKDDAVEAVREYIAEYDLKKDDFFVGRFFKHGSFKPLKITPTAYRNMLKKWIQLTPYNLRKTQVVSMHLKGADLSTIAAQTGHKSLQVLDKHYLTVSNPTIDKYL